MIKNLYNRKSSKTNAIFKESVSECNNMLTQIHQNNESLLQSSLEQTAKVLKSLQQDSQVHGEDVKRLMETFGLMNNKLDEKDKEIKRYKEGCDVSQIKKSVSGYIKVRDRITNTHRKWKNRSRRFGKIKPYFRKCYREFWCDRNSYKYRRQLF